MVSLWLSVEDKSDSFSGVYTRLVDSTNPEAREFLWKRLNDSYYSKGISSFWIDQADGGTLGEPFQSNGQNAIRGIPYTRTFTQYFVGTQEASGKMYPWFHQQAIDEAFQNLTSSAPGLPTS
ncbi:hypothetical protein MPER_04547, partial [Moniliophthora perniciosa FA553]